MLFKVVTTIAVTLAVAVLAAPTPYPRRASSSSNGLGPNGMAVPLTKHSSLLNTKKTANLNTTKIIREVKSSARNMGTPRASTVKRARGCAQSCEAGVLTNPDANHPGVVLKHETHSWYGTISIGTPAKPFTVGLDTGSSDLFVPALYGDRNCRSHPNVWNVVSSRTAVALNQDFEIEFADGSISKGKQYTDTVTFAGFTADSQTIGAAIIYSSEFALSQFAPDGLLGLAFPSLSEYHDQRPLLYTLFSEGKLPQPVFSLKLADPGGELYVGGMNEALYIDSSLAFVPVTNLEYWELKIDNIKVNDKIVLTDVPAVVDTGSHLFWGDPSRVSVLHQTDGGKAFEDGYYTFPCSSFPSVTFTIGGKSFLVPANALRQHQVEYGSSDCFSGIVAHPAEMNDGTWSLGTIFLQQFYTVFDFGSQPRVGFATLAS